MSSMSSSVFPNAVEKLTMIKIDKRLKECADGGGKKLDFSGLGLTSFDSGIIEKFSTTLEELNLGDNLLSSFPTNFTELKRLRILFCANNKFKDVPVILGSMSSLYMLSFKGNEVVHVHEESLSPSICWLILTDNQITALPASIGKLRGLRKCMLAGNRLRSLPREMAGCVELELLRLAANNLEEIPDWLLKLPKLAWLALAGNRCLPSVDDSIPSDDNASNIVPTFKKRDIIMGDRIGDGASGVVYEARVRDTNEQVAVKVFKGECTSDGRPADEMRAAIFTGGNKTLDRDDHGGAIPKVLGKLRLGDKVAILQELISGTFEPLGLPPSFQSVTRDTFHAATRLKPVTILSIVKAVIGALFVFHVNMPRERRIAISHGDLYAHNILVGPPVDGKGPGSEQVRLCDMGAATFYDPSTMPALACIEVRAFGCLVDDLLEHVQLDPSDPQGTEIHSELQRIRDQCLVLDVSLRPSIERLHEDIFRFH